MGRRIGGQAYEKGSPTLRVLDSTGKRHSHRVQGKYAPLTRAEKLDRMETLLLMRRDGDSFARMGWELGISKTEAWKWYQKAVEWDVNRDDWLQEYKRMRNPSYRAVAARCTAKVQDVADALREWVTEHRMGLRLAARADESYVEWEARMDRENAAEREEAAAQRRMEAASFVVNSDGEVSTPEWDDFFLSLSSVPLTEADLEFIGVPKELRKGLS